MHIRGKEAIKVRRWKEYADNDGHSGDEYVSSKNTEMSVCILGVCVLLSQHCVLTEKGTKHSLPLM